MMNSKTKKVLFVDTVHPVIRQEFEKSGLICDFFQDYNKADFEKIVAEYLGIIIRGKILIDKEFIVKAKKLKFIGRVGSGMENIDVEFAEQQGVQCFNSPEGSRDAVGEHAIGLLISLMRNINISDRQVRLAEWIREGNRGTEIKGKTVGIIGYGNMGSAFAEKISGFGTRVVAYDKYKSVFADDFVEEVDMQTIFNDTDILSLHIPLTDETRYLVDRDYLQKFRKDIFLINTARGLNVKTSDLVEAIKTGEVKGAALDVLEYEDTSFERLNKDTLPESFQYLAKSEKVVLTSHIAGWTNESKYKLGKVLADKILKELKKTNTL